LVEAILNKGSEALENNPVGLKVLGYVDGVGEKGRALTPFLLYIIFFFGTRKLVCL